MLYAIKDREDMEKLEELASLKNEVNEVRLQDKLGKQIFHEDMKKVFEPVTKSLEKTSQDKTKTITESSITNNKAIENLNYKLLEILYDRGILASYLMSPLSKFTNPENSTQFELIKDSSSNGVNDLKINRSIPITLHKILLQFRDTNKQVELKGDLLKMRTNKKYNVDLAILADKKLLYDFAKEMYFVKEVLVINLLETEL